MTDNVELNDDDTSGVMRQSVDGINEMPWQVKAIALIGVPSVIALYLVYILAGSRATEHADFTRDMQVFHRELQVHASEMTEHAQMSKQTAIQMDAIIRVLRNTCVNASIDAGQQNRRDRCFE